MCHVFQCGAFLVRNGVPVVDFLPGEYGTVFA
jgi:hypothetical protein